MVALPPSDPRFFNHESESANILIEYTNCLVNHAISIDGLWRNAVMGSLDPSKPIIVTIDFEPLTTSLMIAWSDKRYPNAEPLAMQATVTRDQFAHIQQVMKDDLARGDGTTKLSTDEAIVGVAMIIILTPIPRDQIQHQPLHMYDFLCKQYTEGLVQ